MRLICGEFFSQQASQAIPAVHDRAFTLVPAGKLQVTNVIVIDTEERHQGDFFFLALRCGLLQQADSIAAFEEALSGKTDNLVEIVISQAPRDTADHDVFKPAFIF